jgi:hypothetical protein
MTSITHSGGVVDGCEVGGNLLEGNGAVPVCVDGSEPGAVAVDASAGGSGSGIGAAEDVRAGGNKVGVEGLELLSGQVTVVVGVVLVEDFLGCGGEVGHV